ncbi:MAG: hypothetical protein JW830_16005 [Bacteroidales bacterium]|nr:hypothetical protein [Bacteroidales bacterium]
MNKLFQKLALLALILLPFSCNKTDDKSDGSFVSYFTVNNEKFKLTNGIYSVFYNDKNDYYEIQISIYSGFTDYHWNDDDDIIFEGKGNIIIFYINSPSAEIIPGNYINGSDNVVYDCDEILFAAEYNSATETYKYLGESNDDGIGVIHIEENDGNYEITFSFNRYLDEDNTEDNIIITGEYSGGLSFF